MHKEVQNTPSRRRLLSGGAVLTTLAVPAIARAASSATPDDDRLRALSDAHGTAEAELDAIEAEIEVVEARWKATGAPEWPRVQVGNLVRSMDGTREPIYALSPSGIAPYCERWCWGPNRVGSEFDPEKYAQKCAVGTGERDWRASRDAAGLTAVEASRHSRRPGAHP